MRIYALLAIFGFSCLAVTSYEVCSSTLLVNLVAERCWKIGHETKEANTDPRFHCDFRAAKTGQGSIVQKLVEKGVSKDAKDQDGNTPLDLALTSNDELTINLLLKGGRNFTKQETADLQSLHFSARTGDLDMIKE